MNLIFSADANWGIGKDNQLLFRVSPDMRHFKAKTLGGAVIMGRKTLESLPGGKPLPGRVNIVLTRNPDSLEPCLRQSREEGLQLWSCRDLSELALCLEQQGLPPERVWVIGGAEIYRLLLPYCSQAWVTRFLAAAAADCFMADLDEEPDWRLVEEGERQEWEGLGFRFDLYRNEKPRELHCNS